MCSVIILLGRERKHDENALVEIEKICLSRKRLNENET